MMATRTRRMTFALIAALALLIAGAHGATVIADGPIGRNVVGNVYGNQVIPLIEDGSVLVYGPDQNILSRTSPGASASWHLVDHLESLRFATNGAGPDRAYEYGPFGGGIGARYARHPRDVHQNVYLTPGRIYDASLGQFLSVDPQREDAGPYVYAGNNPIDFLDPSGGGKYPFYVFTGFETRQPGTKKMSSKADAVASIFGRNSSSQNAISSEMFNTIYDAQGVATSSPAESHPYRYTNNKWVDYEKMYLLIGDDVDAEQMGRLAQGINALEGERPEFARKVTILNFSGKEETGEYVRKLFEPTGRKPLLVYARLETTTHGTGGRRAVSFTSGSVAYRPPEFVGYVRGLEEAHRASVVADHDHPWIVGRSLPRQQLTPLGNPPPHEVFPPQHGLTPLANPPYEIPLLPPEPMDTSD